MKQWFVALTRHKLAIFTLFISFPLYCTQSTYYIKPTADTPCPGEPCHTLSQYGEEFFQRINSTATLVFLSGEHTLNFTISVGTLPDDSQPDYYYYSYYSSWDDSQPGQYYPPSSLTLLGSPSSLPEITSRIVCTWPAGFIFSGITELNITALAFISCGHKNSAAINIFSVGKIGISSCSFQNNTNNQSGSSEYGFGGAINVRNGNLTLAENTFRHNFAYFGGAIQIDVNTIVAISRNTFQNNSAFVGGALDANTNNILTLSENIFQNNTADYAGGALEADTNNILTLSENTFHNNSAYYGGALIADTNNTLTLSENTFQNNSADYAGGALYAATNNTLTLSENIFQNNTADIDGGALYADTNNTLTLSENTFQYNSAYVGGDLEADTNNILTLSENIFQYNSAYAGGALHADTNNILTLSENTFQNNTADNDGGALYADTNNILTLSENIFQYNSADYAGGALEANTNNILTLSENIFQNNSADYGGALYADTNNTLTLSENIFQNNSADDGGALYANTNNILTLSENIFHNNSAYVGGALEADTNNILTLSENTFQNNSADYGGALIADTNNTLTLSENTFQNNTADDGGALYADTNNTLTLSENTFQYNSAYVGGDLEADTNNILTLSENIFQYNSAYAGGALHADTNNILTLSENTFQNNTADNDGGALYADTNNILTLSENIFQYNSADYAGGALEANTNNILTLSENIFQNNSADYGGALYADTNNTLTLSENIFQNNSADDGGALYANTNNILTLSENIFHNNSAYVGGALEADTNNILTLSENTFQNNSADYGGALIADTNNTLTLSENTFQNNTADDGGALYADTNNILTLSENIFQNNTADYAGGALEADTNNILTLSANTFHNNSAYYGGALIADTNNTLTLSENTFQNNSADYVGGALYAATNNTLTLSENIFQNNTADIDGGALYADTNNTLTLSENIFQNNTADIDGGALYADTNNTLTLSENTFLSNSAVYGGVLAVAQSTVNLTNNTLTGNTAIDGGAILCFNKCTLQAHGSHNLQNNTAQRGGAIAALGSQIILTGNITLENNTAYYGGGIYTEQSKISGYAYFSKNSAYRSGGGIYALRSNLYFEQYIVFDGNSALNGGGLLLAEGSKLYLWPNTTVDFKKNSAQQKGGAIKVAKSNPLGHCVQESCEFLIGSECFFQIQTEKHYNLRTDISEIAELRNVRIHFENNTALEAGAMLYGGLADSCSLTLISQYREGTFQPYTCPKNSEVFDYITSVEGPPQDISSDPLYICSCEGGEPDCSKPSITRSVYPGGMIEVAIIAYGQRNGATPAVVNMITPGDKTTTKETEKTQNITKGCTALNYTVQTRKEGSIYGMTLHVGPCAAKERTVSLVPTNIITFEVAVLECPPGFELSGYEPLCKCAQRLEQYTNTCSIADSKIERATDHEFWVGYKQDNTSDGLILHPHCPFDYCTSNKMDFTVDDSDEQCSSNRTGLLCGKCDRNFSLVLGTNRCLQCSDDYLWLIVAFAFAGMTLVLLLLVLRLTVAVGTINGLIFYANIFAMNSATFFTPHTNVLTVFIAWLNLDLGIETCFYDGMDAYTKAWLQFAFPFYVWALVGIIILVSHYSAKVATILGTNPIAVLATLFLLSYTKLLRSVIAALSYTRLEYSNSTNVAVWLNDGNIGYLNNKHTPLFIGALVCLIVLFLPYTLFLIFSQWLRSKSGRYRILFWVNDYRVLPFLDAYHAPYTDKHRYWTGLMLLVRCALFLLFAYNTLGDPSVNLLAIGSVSAILPMVYALLGNRIYKTWYLNTLELSFIVNLCILALATIYIRSTGGNQNAVTYTSVSIAFATFVGIVIYHSVQQIKQSPQLWRKMFPRDDTYELVPRTDSNPESMHPPSPPDPSDGTATVVHIDLRDLLENARNELREPCIEMDN